MSKDDIALCLTLAGIKKDKIIKQIIKNKNPLFPFTEKTANTEHKIASHTPLDACQIKQENKSKVFTPAIDLKTLFFPKKATVQFKGIYSSKKTL